MKKAVKSPLKGKHKKLSKTKLTKISGGRGGLVLNTPPSRRPGSAPNEIPIKGFEVDD